MYSIYIYKAVVNLSNTGLAERAIRFLFKKKNPIKRIAVYGQRATHNIEENILHRSF